MSELHTGRLRQARERFGMNQTQLAELLGTAKTLPGQWERGEREPSLTRLKQLAETLEVTSDWLLGLERGTAPIELHDLPTPRERATSRAAVLADYRAPIGLRDLATDVDLVMALRIGPEEWAALHSLDYEGGLTKEGQVALLMLMRGCSLAARKAALAAQPGRPQRPLDTPVEPAVENSADDSA
jgi:transcriptional regulator with XRE-family HTH domain